MVDLRSYFDRVGYDGSRMPTVDTLRALHRLHPLAIPFENLDTLSGRPILLDVAALEDKLVAQRRGGYCFEHNLLFSHVLTALGYRVSALAARVLWNSTGAAQPSAADIATRPRSHMLLLVEVEDDAYLSDVGFGGLTLTAPLRLQPSAEQTTPHEVFRLVRYGEDCALEAKLGADWRPLYCFDLQPQQQIDIEVLNHFVSTHPSSAFRTMLMAAKPGSDRRYGLRNNELMVRYASGSSERRTIESADELRDVLGRVFGIEVPTHDEVDDALRRVTEIY